MFSNARRLFNKTVDLVISNLVLILPNSIKWLYRFYVKQQITPFLIKENPLADSQHALLFLHGNFQSVDFQGSAPLLLLHGMYGHPLALLHLADIAQKVSLGPIFSLYLRYDELKPEVHRSLIKLAIDKIEMLVEAQGIKFKGLVTAGHSMGAIESAYRAFVSKDSRIQTVISIAGRLRVVQSKENPCRESLMPTVESVYKGIQEQPEVPLYQIAAGADWNAPLEATIVRQDDACYHIVENAMHFNVLYHKETCHKFNEFLKSSLMK
jgi:hypothetical protein